MFFRKFPKAEKQFEEDTNTFCRVNPESQDNATPSEPKNRNPLKDFRKNIGFSAFFSKHKKEGSLSLEAAVAVPVFLMAVLAFYSFFPALMSCLKLKAGMEEAGRTIAGCYYIKEKLTESDDAGKTAELAALAGEDLALTVISEASVKAAVRQQAGEYADERFIEGGETGVSFLGTHYDEAEKTLYIWAGFLMKAFLVPGIRIPVGLMSVHRTFTGKGDASLTEEEIVFITEYGEVYHTSMGCRYLDLSINKVSKYLAEEKRNADGDRYRPCELCIEEEPDDYQEVFITSYGNRYHLKKRCPGLKRTIYSVPLSQAGGRRLCKKCGKGGSAP